MSKVKKGFFQTTTATESFLSQTTTAENTQHWGIKDYSTYSCSSLLHGVDLTKQENVILLSKVSVLSPIHPRLLGRGRFKPCFEPGYFLL